jgi:hypothetical protein
MMRPHSLKNFDRPMSLVASVHLRYDEFAAHEYPFLNKSGQPGRARPLVYFLRGEASFAPISTLITFFSFAGSTCRNFSRNFSSACRVFSVIATLPL